MWWACLSPDRLPRICGWLHSACPCTPFAHFASHTLPTTAVSSRHGLRPYYPHLCLCLRILLTHFAPRSPARAAPPPPRTAFPPQFTTTTRTHHFRTPLHTHVYALYGILLHAVIYIWKAGDFGCIGLWTTATSLSWLSWFDRISSSDYSDAFSVQHRRVISMLSIIICCRWTSAYG